MQGRLSNKAFTDKAPADVIDKAQQQLSDAVATKTALLEQIDRMKQFLNS